jgi:hypothetical protein
VPNSSVIAMNVRFISPPPDALHPMRCSGQPQRNRLVTPVSPPSTAKCVKGKGACARGSPRALYPCAPMGDQDRATTRSPFAKAAFRQIFLPSPAGS